MSIHGIVKFILKMWKACEMKRKKFQRMLGTRQQFLQSYLDKFAWRRNYGRTHGKECHNIMTHIAQQYPVWTNSLFH